MIKKIIKTLEAKKNKLFCMFDLEKDFLLGLSFILEIKGILSDRLLMSKKVFVWCLLQPVINLKITFLLLSPFWG